MNGSQAFSPLSTDTGFLFQVPGEGGSEMCAALHLGTDMTLAGKAVVCRLVTARPGGTPTPAQNRLDSGRALEGARRARYLPGLSTLRRSRARSTALPVGPSSPPPALTSYRSERCSRR